MALTRIIDGLAANSDPVAGTAIGQNMRLVNYTGSAYVLAKSSLLALNNQSLTLQPGESLSFVWTGRIWQVIIQPQVNSVEGINVKDFGAIGDGIVDDTNAIIAALESANSLANGTWESAGDNYVTYPTRNRRAVILPFGTYRLTRSIPIKYRGVIIIGSEPFGSSEPSEGRKTILYSDHISHTFDVDATYNVNGFSLKNLYILKRNAFIGSGNGINVTGANYIFGLNFENVHIMWHSNGFYMVCQGLSDGTGSMADLVFKNCQVANNSSYGLQLRGHAAIGGIFNSSFVSNSVGGIKMGCKGFSISNTDFEGQENPIAIANGSASEAVQIGPGNYFEGNPVTATPALIVLGLVDGFRVEANQFSGDSLCPRVLASSCANGWIDEPAQLIGSSNVVVRGGLVLPTAGTGDNTLSFSYNANRLDIPHSGSIVLNGLNERAGGTDYFIANGRMLSASLVTAAYRQLTNGFTNIANNNYVFFAFSIKYTSELPHGNPTVQMLGDIGAGVVVLKEWGLYLSTDGLKIGDNVNFIVGMKNNTGATMSTISLYVYPYGSDTTVGSGAKVSQILQWRQTDAAIQNFNPLAQVSGEILFASNSASGSTLGTVVKKIQVFDSSGNSLGYIPVYDAIT